MEFFYYVQTELVIEYKNKYGINKCIYTNREVLKNYIDESIYCDIVYGSDSVNKNIKDKIERIIKDNTYNIILYQNGAWLEESYKNKYKTLVSNIFPDISELIRVYNKNTAYETML